MEKAEFLSKVNTYQGDYDGMLRSPHNEFKHGLHYHDFYELVIYLGNAGVFHIDDEEYLVRRGDLVLIDMFRPHYLQQHKNSTYYRFSISINLSLLISFSTPGSNLLNVFHNCSKQQPIYHLEENELQKYILLIQSYQQTNLNQGQDIMQKAIIHQLLAYVYNDCYNGRNLDSNEVQHMQIISTVLDHIDAHLGEDIALSDLAGIINYSEYYLCRLFKKATGKTLTNYIQEKRIERATYLLTNHDSINYVAEQVGFNNYSYFYKTFKKYTGLSPAEYQAAHRVSK